MAVGAVVQNGQIVTSATQESLSKANNDSVNKDDFLQLLVAQMQYQDPMEPTDNTQWVTQYAQFSQVEELQNMAQNMSLSRASSLVGQTVIMNVEDAKGGVTEVQGNVDFVSYEGGNAFLSINGELYSMNDLKHVVDANYITAMDNAGAFVEALGKLPALDDLALSDKSRVEEVATKYYNLTEREVGLLGSDEFKAKLDKYIEKMMSLVKASEVSEA